MTDCCDTEWLEARITATRALIVKYEQAIDALSTGAQSYTLDTGQTRQVVQKSDLSQMILTLQRLESRLSTYEQRLGCGRTQARPAW